MFDRPKPTVDCSAKGRRRRRRSGAISLSDLFSLVLKFPGEATLVPKNVAVGYMSCIAFCEMYAVAFY